MSTGTGTIIEYFTLGSRDEAEGLTLHTRVVDHVGNIIVGYQHHDKLYKVKQISKEQAESIMDEMRNPENKGFFGLVNDEGKADMRKRAQEMTAKFRETENKKQALITKRLTRQLEAGLIDEEDLDTAIEIELPGVPVDQIAAIKDQISVIRVKHKVM